MRDRLRQRRERRALKASWFRRPAAALSTLMTWLDTRGGMVGTFAVIVASLFFKVGVFLALGWASGSFTVDENTGCSPSDRGWSDITYELEAVPGELGTPDSAHITIRTADGVEQDDIGLPLRMEGEDKPGRTVEFCEGAKALVEARTEAPGQLKCRITVDGKVKVEHTGAASSPVRCELTVP
jgi:hypothetical protein